MTNPNLKLVARSQWEPDGLNPLMKFIVPERKIDEASRRITFTISTGARDRDGDIIEQAGWELGDYRKNPVVLWAHDGSSPPIARAESVAVEGSKLVSVARFPTREEYAFADTVFQLYKGGFLNATSVGFQPEELELMEGEDPGDIGFRFLRQKLMEYSAVPVPSNPEALVVARGAGIDVKPCAEWIERLLDEHGGGSIEGLLNRTYIALNGKLHPVMLEELAAKNAANLKAKADKAPEDDEAPMLSTGSGGEDGHSHQLFEGNMQTEPGGEDGHVHAVSYADDGAATIQGAEGHTHDAPTTSEERNGDVDSEEEVSVQTPSNDPLSPIQGEPENQRDGAVSEERAITDWPEPGMSLPVSLLTSQYRTFPLAEAKALRDDWPEIWKLGEDFKVGSVDWVSDSDHLGGELTIRRREKWAAKHVDGYEIADVVAQIKHLVRGSRGIEHTRLMLSHAKEHVMNERDKAKGLSPEEIDAVTDRIVLKAVLPAIEKAFRDLSGRVS